VNLARAPLVPVAVAFGTGIAVAALAAVQIFLAAWLIAVVVCLTLITLDRAVAAAGVLLLGVVAVGGLRGAQTPLPPDHVGNLALPQTVRVEGRLAAEPRRWAPDRARLLLETDRVADEPRVGLIQVAAYGVLPALTEGQRIAAPLRLSRAAGFRNPGTYDSAARLARDGIYVVATTRADAVSTLDDPEPPWPVRARRESVAAIGRALPPTSAALLAGLLLGDRSDLPRDVDDAFRRAGVYHVLAVSGFNVGILAASVWALCRLLRLPHRPSAVLAIVVVVGFALVVGPEPSVLRAVVMAVLVLVATLLDRDASVTNSLSLAALAILAVRPNDLFDPGFQLSFAATLGIVVTPLSRGVILGALSVSAAAQLAVLPISLTHFNQLSTIGLVANLGVVPLAAVATVGGLVAVGLSFLSEAVASVAFDAIWPVLLALRWIVALAARVPGAVVYLPAPGWPAVMCYVAGLASLLVWRDVGDRDGRRRRVWLLLGGALLAFAIGFATWPLVRPADGRLRLTVLDVGQGDAIVIEMPDGRALVVDAGSGGPMHLDTGERVVAPFLWNRGILRLAGLAVTHTDSDHAGGAGAIRRLFTIDEEWTALNPPTPRRFGGAGLAALPPTVRDDGRRNEAALVLRIDMGLASFLLTSDIGVPRERELAASGAQLDSMVLKVAHHGSRSSTSAEFLHAVNPRLAAISVGARNAYGHPDAGVVARLSEVGAQVYRTDRDGALIFETDGHVLTITRWASGRVEPVCLDPEPIC
jgi:competence protein ComEC